jgi:HD-like signal output (HDOD) protein
MHRGRKVSLEAADVMRLVEEFHARIADIVSKQWNLPEHVRLAAVHHENPDEAPEFQKEIRTTALAGELAKWVIWGAKEDQDALRKIPLWEVLGFDDDDVNELVERCLALRGITASALL